MFQYLPGDDLILADAFLTLPPEWASIILDEYLTAFPVI